MCKDYLITLTTKEEVTELAEDFKWYGEYNYSEKYLEFKKED